MTAITKLLSSQAIDDTVRAFRTAIRIELDEVKKKEKLLNLPTTLPDHELLKKQIAQAKEEIFRLNFSFGQITGMAFDAELNLIKTPV